MAKGPPHANSEEGTPLATLEEQGVLKGQKTNDLPLQITTHRMLEHYTVLLDAQDLHVLAANFKDGRQHHQTGQDRPSYEQNLIDLLRDGLWGKVPPNLLEQIHTTVQTGDAFAIEMRNSINHANGETYWNWTSEPFFDQGQVRFVLLAITDVTTFVKARQQAEQDQAPLLELQHNMERERLKLEQKEKILTAIHNSVEPHLLASSVFAALYTCFAPLLQALYWTSEEQGALSLLALQAHPGRQEHTPPFPASLRPPLEVIDQRTPVVKRKSQDIEKEAFLSLPDCSCILYFPVWGTRCEGILTLAFAREEDVTNLLITILTECAPYLAETLISARRYTALLEERQRLYTMLEHLPEGVLFVEAQTSSISYANSAAAHLLGRSLPQLIGVPLNQSVQLVRSDRSNQHPPSAFPWNFALIDALWGKTSSNQELLISRPDGSDIVVLSSTAPLRKPNGIISEAVIAFQDITAAKRLEQEKSEFFAVANHELRTPVTIIAGFADLLQQCSTHEANEMYHYALRSITHECEHLTQLIESFLDVSHLEMGRVDVQRKMQDLLGLLQHIVTIHMHSTATHHVLHLTLQDLQPEEHLLGWFDHVRIEHLFNNLLSNAIKYSPAGSTIEVGVRPNRDPFSGEKREALIWVKDQGIGIAPHDRPHIFERFYRARTLDPAISGFGIGLYLTREMVRGHGGRIWVESEEGQGSTFFVALPLGKHCAAPP